MTFNRLSHCIRIDKFTNTGYISIPKAGCSTIQKMLANSWAAANDLPFVSNPHSKRGRELLHYWNSPDRPYLTDLFKSTSFFTAVRNPYTRLLSAWLDKIRGAKKEGVSFARQHNLGNPAELSFSNFVETLFSSNTDFFDHHWATQVSICNLGRIPFKHIGSLEAIHDTIKWIKGHIPITNSHSEIYAPHGTASINKISQYYNDSIAEKVFHIYRKDFATFKYSRDINCLDPIEGSADRTQRLWLQYDEKSNKLLDLYEQSIRHDEISNLSQLFLDLAADPQLANLIKEHDWQFFASLSLKHRSNELPAYLSTLLTFQSPKSQVIAASIALSYLNNMPLAKQLAEKALEQTPCYHRALTLLKRIHHAVDI